jgi:hypothetical protein
MNYKLKYFLTSIVILINCGCIAPNIDLASEDLSSIETIAVIKSPEIKSYVFDRCCGWHAITASTYERRDASLVDPENKIGRIKQTLNYLNLKIPLALAEDTVEDLSRAGFQARLEVGAPWRPASFWRGKKIKHEDIQSDADAVLLIDLVSFSFETDTYSGPYWLNIWVRATLLDKTRKNILYRGNHTFGGRQIEEEWRHTPSTVTYADFDQISDNPEQVASHIAEGISGIASTIASDLSF